MRALIALRQAVQRAIRPREPAVALDRAPDLRLAFALTQLLIDSGRADAAGCIVVATWRTPTHVVFQVICAERIRPSLCSLLAGFLSRPFHAAAGAWLLSQREAAALIDSIARPSV